MLILPREAVEKPSWAMRPGGLIVPDRLAARRPTGVDLFSGCGGMSLGVMQAGFQVVAALDNECNATVTYMENLGAYPFRFHFASPEDEARMEAFLQKCLKGKGIVQPPVAGSGWISHYRSAVLAPDQARRFPSFIPGETAEPPTSEGWGDGPPGVEHFFFGDVRRFSGKQILDAAGLDVGELDCVFGGPPCQGFSTSGKRNVMDPRNSLVFEFARLVCEMQPRTIVMENVPGICSMVTPEGIPVLDALCLILEEGGFGTADALKASLAGKAGRGAAVRHKRVAGKKTSAKKKAKRSISRR